MWGIAIGYVLADLKSETNGMLIFGTTKGNETFVTTSLLLCSAIGLILGYLLDMKKLPTDERFEWLKTSSRILTISFIVFVVVAILSLSLIHI